MGVILFLVFTWYLGKCYLQWKESQRILVYRQMLSSSEYYKLVRYYKGNLMMEKDGLYKYLPKDGPYSDEKADKYCTVLFSNSKACQNALKRYYELKKSSEREVITAKFIK